jgi:GNAT superfamily N-acetyltransferase
VIGAGVVVETQLTFRPYARADRAICLHLFDLNSPKSFAPNERRDYEAFLDEVPGGYELCIADGKPAGAFGLTGDETTCRRLNWILIDPGAQGMGIGSAMMRRALAQAGGLGLKQLVIAASHLSAPFFVKFGAVVVSETEDGWGPGMHRWDMELPLQSRTDLPGPRPQR